ncbi:hypothetical protein ACTMTI_36750 [Nonomuraea sp. H19]|uniref:hypothetical protein n=1 Tax=Nonomuraea sp. H19 TaxID=3452206 RepID=UPI003F8A85F0
MTPAQFIASAVIVATLIITVRYAVECYMRPFRRCHACQGKGRKPNRFGRGSRDCRRCRATGLRLRIGRHLWNHARALHRDATR